MTGYGSDNSRRQEAIRRGWEEAVRAVVRRVSGVTVQEIGHSETEGPYAVLRYVARWSSRSHAFTLRVTKVVPAYRVLDEWVLTCEYEFERLIAGENYAELLRYWGGDND